MVYDGRNTHRLYKQISFFHRPLNNLTAVFTFARPPPTFYSSRRKAGKTVTVRHNIIIVQEKSDGIWLNIALLVSALQCRVRKTFEEIKSDNGLTNRSVVWRDEDTNDFQVSIIILSLFVFIYFHHILAYQQIFMRSIWYAVVYNNVQVNLLLLVELNTFFWKMGVSRHSNRLYVALILFFHP